MATTRTAVLAIFVVAAITCGNKEERAAPTDAGAIADGGGALADGGPVTDGGGATPPPPDAAVTDASALYFPPDGGARPSVGAAYVDPSFGTVIRRVSDRAGLPGATEFEVNIYSQLQAFSADNAYVLTTSDLGYIVRRMSDFGQVSGLPLTDINVPRWHPTEANILVHFDTNSDSTVRLQRTNATSGQVTTIATFPAQYTTILGSRSFDELSRDGRWIAGMLTRPPGEPVIFAYDIVDGGFGAELPISYLYDGGGCAPDPQYGEVWPDWVAPSPLGRYLVVQWVRDGTARCSGLESFDIVTGAYVGRASVGHSHGDLGLGPDGGEYFMTFDPARAEGIGLFYAWLPGPASGVATQNDVLLLPFGNSDHISCQGPAGVCLVSAGADPGNGWNAFEAELFLVYLNGTVWRIAHHRSSVCGYWAQPRATLSQDGRFVAFSSDWGFPECSQANESGTGDLYIIQLR